MKSNPETNSMEFGASKARTSLALGIGDFSAEIEAFAEKMGFDCVRI